MHTCLSQWVVHCLQQTTPSWGAGGIMFHPTTTPGGRVRCSPAAPSPSLSHPWFRSTPSPRILVYLKLKLKFFIRLNFLKSWIEISVQTTLYVVLLSGKCT